MSAIDPTAIPQHGGHDADDHGREHHAHDHPPHLAHHFDTPEQQFDSAKIGMWAFLATEILMFGGLFCAYAVYRYNNPNVFRVGEHHLDTTLGAINTVVLLASSLTMALAVRAAQLGQKTYLILMLCMTLLGAVGFMCIKTVEYKAKYDHGLMPGRYNAYDRENNEAGFQKYVMGHGYGGNDHGEGGDPSHAATGEYADGVIPALKGDSAEEVNEGGMVAGEGDESHRPVGEARGIAPALEGPAEQSDGVEPSGVDGHRNSPLPTDINNPSALSAAAADEDMPDNLDIAEKAGRLPANPAGDTAEMATGEMQNGRQLAYLGPDYVDPNFGTGDAVKIRPKFNTPTGIATTAHAGHGAAEFEDLSVREQSNVKAFFNIYFMMTGLHGLHVVIGMGLIGWILLRSVQGTFGPAYYTPVDLVGLYWHLVDLIWIFLFPLLYLIH